MAANLTIVAARVKLIRLDAPLLALPAAEVITKGQLMGVDSNGKWCLADADTGPIYPRAVCIKGASQANETAEGVAQGIIDMGDALGDLAYGAFVYASATAGAIYDGSVNSLPAIGWVEPSWGTGASVPDKFLHVDVRW